VKPAPFTYVRARTLDEAVAWLARGGGEARILAGGQSLVPLMNMRLVRPATVVDINAVPGLAQIQATAAGGVRLGALVRHADLAAAPLARARAPLLAVAAAHVGHRAIRNRGTLGGSLAHADPAAELPAAALALDARVIVAGPRGERAIAAAEFFHGLFATALGGDEVLTAVELAAPPEGWGFAEVARRAGDFALAGVAAALRGGAGTCREARLVAFGAGDRPLRLPPAETLLRGAPVDDALARRAGEAAAAACAPADDVHASAAYRRHLVAVLTERALREAWQRLAAGPHARPEGRP
jgi:carbon-monoxide dehydrogenase medium subunit